MLKHLAIAFSGILFGLGLIISQMINPKKVIGFLDVTGQWDPSLLLVMVGALLTLSIMQHFILKKPKPLLADRFNLPEKTQIDKSLLAGAALFGIGWGLAGFCPGPALVSITYGQWETWLFCLAMFSGMRLYSWVHEAKKSIN